MDDDNFTEPAAELLAQAALAGHVVSTNQLARWHRAGLLPSPIQKGLGQKLGSEVKYPRGTTRQLIALCVLRKNERRFAHNGWALWWHGFPVSENYSRGMLKEVATWWDGAVSRIREIAKPEENEGDISEEYLDLVDSAKDSRIDEPIARRMRKRVRSGNYPSLLRMISQMIIGTFGEQEYATTTNRDIGDETIMEKAMGISRARKDQINGMGPWLTGSISPDLTWMARCVFDRPLIEVLEETPWETIEAARNELSRGFYILDKASLILEQTHRKHAFGLGVIGDIARNADTHLQATMLLLWLALRQDEQMKEGMQGFLRGIMGESKPSDSQVANGIKS